MFLENIDEKSGQVTLVQAYSRPLYVPPLSFEKMYNLGNRIHPNAFLAIKSCSQRQHLLAGALRYFEASWISSSSSALESPVAF